MICGWMLFAMQGPCQITIFVKLLSLHTVSCGPAWRRREYFTVSGSNHSTKPTNAQISPKMVVPVASRDVHANSKELRDLFRLEQVFLAPIRLNASAAHQDDAIDLRYDVGEMVSHEDDSNSRLGQRAHRFAKTVLRENIEAIARLIEHQRLRIVHQRACDQDALRLAGRHFRDGAVCEMWDSKPLENGVGAHPVLWLDSLVIEDACTAEETGENDFAAARVARAVGHQIVRYDAEHGAQLEDVPSVAPQNRHRGFFPDDRIALARNGFDERGLAAAVRAQDRDVFARFDAQAEVIECDVVASNDAHVFQVYQGRSHEVRFSPRVIIISPHVFPLLESSGGFLGGRTGFFNSGTVGACPLSRKSGFSAYRLAVTLYE